MKGKILGLILSITLCSKLFGIQVTNNTEYAAKIATKKVKNNGALVDFECDFIEVGETKEVMPCKHSGDALIGFEKSLIYNFPFPEGNITITEDENNFIITEDTKQVIMAKEGFKALVLKKKPKGKDKSGKSKAGFFTLKKMIVAGGVTAVIGYLIWNYNKKAQKTNNTK